MTSPKNPTRVRLIDAALELFAAQGVTATTTRQIAELAQVNEVTLFRHFGSKHGLLLAVIEDSAVVTRLRQTLLEQSEPPQAIEQALKSYATSYLLTLERVPEVVRSLVGEAGQYPVENREALGKIFTQANDHVAQYLEAANDRSPRPSHLNPEKLASLLNTILLGYAVLELTSEFHDLWHDREDFLENVVTLFLSGTVEPAPKRVADLAAPLVHSLLQQARKLGLQDYALMYVLFGSGLTPTEISSLERSHYVSRSSGQFLRVAFGSVREVPLNQRILGKRYGSYTRNPLTRWLKNRKDSHPALFIAPTGEPLSETLIRQRWQEIVDVLPSNLGHALHRRGLQGEADAVPATYVQENVGAELVPPTAPCLEKAVRARDSNSTSQSPTIEQAQATWCVEMLTRGLSLEELHLLTGLNLPDLQPYAHRAEEKAILEKAVNCDRTGLG